MKRDAAILIGVGLLLLGSRKKSQSASTAAPDGRPLSRGSFAAAWRERAEQLVKRAESGKSWAARLAKRLGSKEAGEAASRWIGIESGGDPRNTSSLDERGLAQVSKQSLAELGLTEADFAAMNSARTTDEQHADMAAAVIAGEVVSVSAGGDKGISPGWGPKLGPTIDIGKGRLLSFGATPASLGIGIAKVRHGLPLLLKELRAQGHIRTTIPLTIRSALGEKSEVTSGPFKPSARLAAFATGKFSVTGDPARDLLLRFLIPAAVVAHGAEAIPMGGAAKENA